ncbi:hypothetical protein JFT44_25410 [Pseudomonas sp. MF5691]|uniref:hypothetical protein n=1 Tax=Pseudomonas sp. MF5691 TaxID=2797526 RepID=UPI0018E8BD40|nr:hypothetical protein [Pseudomonas sp. MF5691]MBJ2293261.1 hypothetical protein [Pseudomonas sp. MF5691]
MVKVRSQSATGRQQPTPDQIEKLAQELADKPFGQSKVKSAEIEQKAQAIGISLPPQMIENLQDAALKNKRSREGQRTVSGIIREVLAREGY